MDLHTLLKEPLIQLGPNQPSRKKRVSRWGPKNDDSNKKGKVSFSEYNESFFIPGRDDEPVTLVQEHDDAISMMARDNLKDTNLESIVDEVDPFPDIQFPTEDSPVANRTRGILSSHPTLRKGNGADMILDWSDRNRKITASTVETEGSNFRLMYNAQSIRNILDDSFKDWQGSKDLLSPGIQVCHIPTLYDEARNCLNHGRRALGKPIMEQNFQTKHFTQIVLHDIHQRQVYACTCETTGDNLFDYFIVGRCQLCDSIANLMVPTLVQSPDHPGGLWGFESFEIARVFLCQCIILTTGSETYYTDLHSRARTKCRRGLKAAEQMSCHSRKNGKWKEDTENDTFILGLGNPESEVPYFFVIGDLNSSKDTKKNTRMRMHPAVAHNFCIAIPDLGYHRKHFGEGTRKPGRSTHPGSAAYIRPIRPQDG